MSFFQQLSAKPGRFNPLSIMSKMKPRLMLQSNYTTSHAHDQVNHSIQHRHKQHIHFPDGIENLKEFHKFR